MFFLELHLTIFGGSSPCWQWFAWLWKSLNLWEQHKPGTLSLLEGSHKWQEWWCSSLEKVLPFFLVGDLNWQMKSTFITVCKGGKRRYNTNGSHPLPYWALWHVILLEIWVAIFSLHESHRWKQNFKWYYCVPSWCLSWKWIVPNFKKLSKDLIWNYLQKS